jgi:hypothetical protein
VASSAMDAASVPGDHLAFRGQGSGRSLYALMTMTQCAGGEIVVYVLSLLLSLLDDGHDDRGLEAKFGRLVPRYQSVVQQLSCTTSLAQLHIVLKNPTDIRMVAQTGTQLHSKSRQANTAHAPTHPVLEERNSTLTMLGLTLLKLA